MSAAYPLWYYEIDFQTERYRQFTRRALESPQCDLRPIDKKRWDEEVQVMRILFNEGFDEEWEFEQFTPEQFKEFYAAFKPTFDPRTTVIAEVEGEPAGMAVGLPDLTPAFRAMRGRLGPIKILRMMRAARRPSRVGLIAIALRPQFRGRRIGAALASTLYRNFEEMGQTGSLYYLVNDSNVRSRGLAESLGGEGRLLYQCYDRECNVAPRRAAPRAARASRRRRGAARPSSRPPRRPRSSRAGRRRTRTAAGASPTRSAPSSKISGCGLCRPTSPEITTPSNSSPNESRS